MLKDATLNFGDAISGTTSSASTSHVDTLAAGDAYVGAWFCVRVDTAFTAGAGIPNVRFQLQTAADTDFTSGAETLCQSATMQAAALTADTFVFKCRIPQGAKRFLRAYKVAEGPAGAAISDANKFSAGTWDAFIVMDAGKTIDGLTA